MGELAFLYVIDENKNSAPLHSDAHSGASWPGILLGVGSSGGVDKTHDPCALFIFLSITKRNDNMVCLIVTHTRYSLNTKVCLCVSSVWGWMEESILSLIFHGCETTVLRAMKLGLSKRNRKKSGLIKLRDGSIKIQTRQGEDKTRYPSGENTTT